MKCSMSSVVSVSQARARLPSLIRQGCFTICRRGKPVGVFLSAERIAALVETLELLEDRDFVAALKRARAGLLETVSLAEAERYWDRLDHAPRARRKGGA